MILTLEQFKNQLTEKQLIDLFADYEIAFEAGEGEGGGVNLGVLHDYYVFQDLEKLV